MSDRSRSCILTGIGGQGVQLAGQVLARAALEEGLQSQLFQNYGGLMRGGQTEASVVVGREAVTAPPVLGTTWSAMVLHHEYWEPVRRRLQPDGVVIVNTSVVSAPGLGGFTGTIVEVPSTDLAVDLGDVLLASMILLGAYCAVTELVSLRALAEGLEASLPPYRREREEAARDAIAAGHGLDGLPTAPAWSSEGAAR